MKKHIPLLTAIALPLTLILALGPSTPAHSPPGTDVAAQNNLAAFIDSPEDQDTVSSGFTVTGIVDAPVASQAKAVDLYIQCILYYEDNSTYSHDPVGVDLSQGNGWTYAFTGAPATALGETAGLVAYVLDAQGNEIGDSYGPVDIHILAQVGGPPGGPIPDPSEK